MFCQLLELLSILILSQFITISARSRSSSSSSSCHCYTYSGDSDNINDNGTCKHCSSCSNGSCKCLSSEECSTTFTIVGIVIGVIVILMIVAYCIRRRRRFRMRQFRQPPVIVEPATYIAPPTQSTQPVVMNSQNVQMINGKPVIYVQPQGQPQPRYITQPIIQQPQYITQPQNVVVNPQQPVITQQQPMVQQPVVTAYPNLNNQNGIITEAPPSYDTVAAPTVPSAPPQ
eukprot:526167_1